MGRQLGIYVAQMLDKNGSLKSKGQWMCWVLVSALENRR